MATKTICDECGSEDIFKGEGLRDQISLRRIGNYEITIGSGIILKDRSKVSLYFESKPKEETFSYCRSKSDLCKKCAVAKLKMAIEELEK